MIISLSAPLIPQNTTDLLILLDDAPAVNATAIAGGDIIGAREGHAILPSGGILSLQVILEGNTLNATIRPLDGFAVLRFYHVNLRLLDASGNRLDNLEVCINGSKTADQRRPIAPYGKSTLVILLHGGESYTTEINVTSSTAITVTLPVSDLNLLLTSRMGTSLANQSAVLTGNSSGRGYPFVTDRNGRVRIEEIPHGVYSVSCCGMDQLILHNSSATHTLRFDPACNLTVDIKNPYILFPTEVSVKVFDNNGRPLSRTEVVMDFGGERHVKVTDGTGSTSFYLPPSISLTDEVDLTALSISKHVTVNRDPLPILLVPAVLAFLLLMKIRWDRQN
ncbi:MAG: hypothetical protein FJZ49_02490 [Candidatus Verstraetearchaeota archaeon]|nr:hypothetical protein [Candidatus Verstraetearchaeota archaeon]